MNERAPLSMALNEIQRELIFRATQEYRRRHADDNPRDALSSLTEIRALLVALRDKERLNEALAITATKFLEAAADETETLTLGRLYIDLKEGIDKEMVRLYEEAKKNPDFSSAKSAGEFIGGKGEF